MFHISLSLSLSLNQMRTNSGLAVSSLSSKELQFQIIHKNTYKENMEFEPETFNICSPYSQLFPTNTHYFGCGRYQCNALMRISYRYLSVINPSIYSITWWGWKKTWFWHRTLILKIFEIFNKITHNRFFDVLETTGTRGSLIPKFLSNQILMWVISKIK
jgi:hypothetical protein